MLGVGRARFVVFKEAERHVEGIDARLLQHGAGLIDDTRQLPVHLGRKQERLDLVVGVALRLLGLFGLPRQFVTGLQVVLPRKRLARHEPLIGPGRQTKGLTHIIAQGPLDLCGSGRIQFIVGQSRHGLGIPLMGRAGRLQFHQEQIGPFFGRLRFRFRQGLELQAFAIAQALKKHVRQLVYNTRMGARPVGMLE